MYNTHTFTVGRDNYTVTVVPKYSISVTRDGEETVHFGIGDWAEYDSYNLKYTGQIVSIGPKTVTIEAYPGTQNAKRHRLKLSSFAWRNWDYDGSKIAAHNAEEMMYI